MTHAHRTATSAESGAGRHPSHTGGSRSHERHRPEETVLYKTVQAHWRTFLSELESAADPPVLPAFVIAKVEAFLYWFGVKLAEVDLDLMTWRCLEANRRHLGGAASLPMRATARCRVRNSTAIPRSPSSCLAITALPAATPSSRATATALVGVDAPRSRPLLRSWRRIAQVPPGSTTADSGRRPRWTPKTGH
jgi:hypothetical protein